MHDQLRRLVAAAVTGLFLASALAVPVGAGSPHAAQVRKAEPRRVVEYRPNGLFTHDTDLLSESGYAAWMIDELLLATTPLPRLGAAFTRAERDTGINARYLVAHAILETGWGTSWIAQVKHNLFGYGAFDRDPLRYATRYSSFAAGIAAVSTEIRAAYLSPDGRWWRGFPTLRGVNRFYASDVLWADKIAVLANAIDGFLVTLRERGLHFGWPRVATRAPGAAVAAGSSIFVEVPWTSLRLGLPAAIRFAVRWTPVALAEGGPTAQAAAPTSTWTLVDRAIRAGQSVRLSVAAPAIPGSWRLEIEARDSDGQPLPVTDAPPIRPLALRVVAAREATISVGLDVTPPVAAAGGAPTATFPASFPAAPAAQARAAGLVATIRNVGRTTIPAVARDGTPTLVEAWSLPLAPDVDAVRLAGAPLVADLRPGAQVVLHLPRPTASAIVVLRLSGNQAAIGRCLAAVVLFNVSPTGGPVLTQLRVPDLRDASLAPPPPTAVSARLAGRRVPPSPGTASVSVVQADAAGEVAIGLVPEAAPAAPDMPAEPPAAAPAILVRTLSTLPADAAGPTGALVEWPGDRVADSPTLLMVPGVPAGIRLVVVGLIPDGGSAADPVTLRLAWALVADPGTDPTPR